MEQQITYKVERVLAELSTYKTTKKLLTLTAWNGRDPKLDLRTWTDEGGKLKPGKGVTLTEDEGKAVGRGLYNYFKAKQ